MKIKHAFTLIELLIVIAIIAVLASIIIFATTSATGNAYDSRRKADIANLYSSIIAKGTSSSYPNLSCNVNQSSPSELKDFIGEYLKTIPSDPKGTNQYFYYSDGNDFAVGAVLEDGTCFVKQTRESFFDSSSCSRLKNGGIGLVENFMVLGGGETYNLKWTAPNNIDINSPTISTALICLGKSKTDSNIPTDNELLTSGTVVAIISGGTEYRYSASNADYNYYCKAITYDNTVVTNPGTVGGTPNTSSNGFRTTGGELSKNYGTAYPNQTSYSNPSSNPPSLNGSNEAEGATSTNFVLTPTKETNGTSTITLSWIPGNLSTHTIIRRAEADTADNTIIPRTLTDGTEVYNRLNTLNGNNESINPNSLHTYIDAGLSDSKYYCYSAWAYDSITNTYSRGYVLACSGIPPSAITNLSIVSHTSSLSLSWTKGGGDKTILRRKINIAPTTIGEGELVYGETGATVDDTSLLKNTNYCYTAWSYNSTLGVMSSTSVSGCSQLKNIGDVTNLTFPTYAYNSINLSWTLAEGSTNSIVIRKQGSIPTSRTDGTQVYNSTANAFLDNELSSNTNYCYAIWGYDGSSYSDSPATGCQKTREVINGACGSASKVYALNTSDYGTDTLCQQGTANPSSPAFPAAGASTSWTCESSGGTTASCSASHGSVNVTKTTSGNYTIEAYTLPENVSANVDWIVPAGVTQVRSLIVGGGGGGGYTYGSYYSSNGGRSGCSGGGGAGGVIDTNIDVEPNSKIGITVGKGGNTNTLGGCAGFSQFGSTIAYGGVSGAGPRPNGDYSCQGGSGGGGNGYYSPSNGTVGQGNPGGVSSNGGGGGGAGAIGGTNGIGGIGIQSDITGTLTYYGGGGGASNGKAGGLGGGGTGCPSARGVSDGYPTANATYYGGGGGAGGCDSTWARDGGRGYQGTVIIKYLTP